MKRLESVKLIQFFLFESEELRICDITGIFGRNGSGKSAFLDAVQIAMMGGNSKLMAFNAQADEKTTRSLRAYCLGQYGSSNDQRIRDNATTYITLIWRDTETNQPTSMGVCLAASADSDTHTVLGRYLAQGVELAMSDHLETVDGRERPRDWRAFRHQLQERSRVTGDDPLFEDSRRYINAAMLALCVPGRMPAYEAFTRAFKFALRMRFDKSVDNIVRHDVLESRPTNIRKFRELTDQFSRLNNMVAYVKKKISDGSKVTDGFAAAMRETRRAVTWNGLALAAKRACASAAYNEAVVKHEAAEMLMADRKLAVGAAVQRVKECEEKHELYRGLMEAHSAHKDFAQAQSDLASAESRNKSKRKDLSGHLSDIQRLLKTNAANPHLAVFQQEMNSFAETVGALTNDLDSLTESVAERAIRPVVKLSLRIVNSMFQSIRTIESQIDVLDQEIGTAKSSLERVRSGRAPLSGPAQTLLTELRDSGLSPLPVCDEVQITDPDWQPVIEAFLGRNVEALLVDGPDEKKAFAIYRGMEGRRTVYGVKIAMASRQKIGEAARPGSVAELIEGSNPAAVAYLRRQFGDILRASTNEEALSGTRTLTKDGMLVGPGSFERLECVTASMLKIGAAGTGQIAGLSESLARLQERKNKLTKEAGTLKAVADALSALAYDSGYRMIIGAVAAAHEARTDLEKATARASATTDAEYRALCDKVAALAAELPEERAAKEKTVVDATKAESAVEVADKAKTQAEKELSEIGEKADGAREHPDYDRLFASEQWDGLLSRFDENYVGMAAFGFDRSTACERESQKLSRIATGNFSTYLAEYRESPGQEICDDWRKSAEWIRLQVERLHGTELIQHEERAAEAYRASQETFRTDVAIALSNNLDFLDETMDRLNAALKDCPVFSNGERYQFVRTIRPDLKPLLLFVKDVASFGAFGDLLGGPGDIPPEFEALLREKVAPGGAGVSSPLDDYREFFEFDIEIRREDPITKELKTVGLLSKRLGTGSGGEHRAPLYVIAGAALASAYRLDKRNRDGVSLILLDEAFDKMDPTNMIATMRYLEELGLQVVMASPGDNLGTLSAFMDRYYEIQRDPDLNVVRFEGHNVSQTMREMFRDDLPEFNSELIERELAAIRNPVPATA